MKKVADLKIKMFADGADKKGMLEMYKKSYIKGFTTNPTLMKKAGIKDFKAFSLDILKAIPDRPVSLSVFSDDIKEMEKEALEISSWGKNVYVKIPITNTKGEGSYGLIERLSKKGVNLNVTAMLSLKQVQGVADAVKNNVSCFVSVFAGRVADTGVDPVVLMTEAMKIIKPYKKMELLWASPRELLNIFQADDIGCHIITATNDILKKLELVGKDLDEYSLETVKMFHNDSVESGYKI